LPGPPTFGCLNNFAKVSDGTLELWMQLLERSPGARLMIHARGADHRERVRRFMRQAGIDEARIAFVGTQPLQEYLASYRLIDVALDPFPFNGGTTTCDALWMGVPVVSLAGETAVSRAGSSVLSSAGLPELVARNKADYLTIAAGLLSDAKTPGSRGELRRRLEASPVMDMPRFVVGLEAAFRQAWRNWCSARG
jgi:predicted O-linked N-acetylglucosamine transferase (SPINDLY family)